MKSLFDFEILVNDVFYRSEHVLNYLERHPNMNELDREALCNTIMDALVYKGLIDPKQDSLNLDEMCIMHNLDYYCYQEQPNVTSIPLYIKEQMRDKSLVITGSIPLAVFYAKPAGQVSFCIYDMNTALSVLFDEFSFIDCNYDSPTREGQRAEKRPFLEITMNGTKYLVDALTKRCFKSSWFKDKYNMVVDYEVSNKEFDERQKTIYEEQTTPKNNYGMYLVMSLPILETLKGIPKQEETQYEMEKSKSYFPESFKEVDDIKRDMMVKGFV